MLFEKITERYDEYVDTFRDAQGALPPMMALKRAHTARVVKNAHAIADGERMSEPMREAVLAAALLHDTGRYEQLLKYNTFRDSESVDHAEFSHQIVLEKGWLKDLTFLDSRSEAAILTAVKWHNKRDLPTGLDDFTFEVANSTRDADKLDIFTVFEKQMAADAGKRDSRTFWNLEFSAPPTPEVAKSVAEGTPVDYQRVKTLADFVLIQVGWMISQLYFVTTRRLCHERGHLQYRREFLSTLAPGDEMVTLACDRAQENLERA